MVIIIAVIRLKINVRNSDIDPGQTRTQMFYNHTATERGEIAILHIQLNQYNYYEEIYDEPDFATLHFKQNITYSQSLMDSITHTF